MSGTNANVMTQPAVSASGEVSTLLIEKFNNEVHKRYAEGENLMSFFKKQSVVGTNMISNKYMSAGKLQKLVPGQDPGATDRQFDKNALIVDTIVLARDYVHDLHRLQNDFDVMSELAKDQATLVKLFEDQLVIQQLLSGAVTGGVYDWQARTITGGNKRVANHGVAIKTTISDAQAVDPYQLVSALEVTIMGLVVQRVPLTGLRVLMPVEEFGLLKDYKFIASTQGGENQISASTMMHGMLNSFNVPVMGSAEFTQSIIDPNFGDEHSLLSNDDNAFRYDFTAEMQKAVAVVFAPKALMAGETIPLQSDIFYDKKTKGYYTDSWVSEGAIPDRYDNLGVVLKGGSENTSVDAKADAKVTRTRT